MAVGFPSRAKILSALEALVIGTAGGLLFLWANLPGGLISGAMVVLLLASAGLTHWADTQRRRDAIGLGQQLAACIAALVLTANTGTFAVYAVPATMLPAAVFPPPVLPAMALPAPLPAPGLAARCASGDSDASFKVDAGMTGAGASGVLAMPRAHKK